MTATGDEFPTCFHGRLAPWCPFCNPTTERADEDELTVTAANRSAITLNIEAVRVKRGWLGQIIRNGAILWESDRHFADADKALDRAYREADRVINVYLTNQPKSEHVLPDRGQ